MKNQRNIVFAGYALLLSIGMNAQTIYDANRFVGSELNGTARFVGMGGAMSALGGDISTMNTNPAGIGIYRSNDLMLSFGFNSTSANSDFSGVSVNSNKLRASFDNMGFVYANKISNTSALRYVNLGFNYQKVKNFNRVMGVGGDLGGLSQTDQMARQSDGLTPDDLNTNKAWGYEDVGWLSILGWQGYLTNYIGDKKFEGFPGANPYGDYTSEERGGISEYDFNASFNFWDKFYLGFTLGVYDVNYNRYSYYREGFDYNGVNDISSYSLENWFRTSGVGVDFKVGAIIRPFDDLPLRIGVAVHTPTFYNLTNRGSALLMSDIDRNGDGQISGSNNPDLNEQFTIDTDKEVGESITDFRLRTPWKYNFSLGYTIGKYAALGAEYEFQNYSTANLKSDIDGYTEDMNLENEGIKQYLKGVHTFRIGTEIRPVPQFAVRFGYNHSTASIGNDAFKMIPYDGRNRIRTDTEYGNTKAVNSYTVGMGFRTGYFYADIAYQYSAYKEDFYLFENIDLKPAKIDNYRSQLLLTLGVRF